MKRDPGIPQSASAGMTQGLQLIRRAMQTVHGRFVLCGLLIGLCYLPVWLGYLIPRALQGKIGWLLILCLLYLAIAELWQKRSILMTTRASTEDRLLGHLLILSSVVLFPVCRFALWSQAMLWFLALVGIACSSWGMAFFRQFKLATFLVGLTVYPRIGLISRTIWELFTPTYFLETGMAWLTTLALQWSGWTARSEDVFIILPDGAVEVGWGCNGLDMAITLAVSGLFIGVVFQQNWVQITRLLAIAVAFALLTNIPRLMLVTVAYVYWGQDWFKFWHGFWGGQIFVLVLSTLYYYLAMYLIKRPSLNRYSPK